MGLYNFEEGSTLGETVKQMLAEPVQTQQSLAEELAMARATVLPLIRQYDECGTDQQRIIAGSMLRDALGEISTLAEKAMKIHKDQIITPATVAALATQIDVLANELLGNQPIIREQFISRLQTAFAGITMVSNTKDQEALPPHELAAMMDHTIGALPEMNNADICLETAEET